MPVERNVRLRHVCIRLTQSRDTSMTVIVGWLISANCADTILGDKFVIGEGFLRPWNRKITTN